ncbi:MAG: hypothetical protein ABW185_17360 [Sedimenticola sp.]
MRGGAVARGRGRPSVVPRKWVRQDTPIKHNYFFDSNWEPHDLFELFFDNDVYLLLNEQTIRYAREKGNHTFQITVEELQPTVHGNALSYRLCSTSKEEDVLGTADGCQNLSDVSRTRFEEILKYLHVCDNNELDKNDRMSKIRPLFSLTNERCLKYFLIEQHNYVD